MGYPTAPQSKLTYERPDIWLRAVAMATDLTGYQYLPKIPLPDGSLSACGYGNYTPESEPTTQQKIEREQRDIDYIKNIIKNINDQLKNPAYNGDYVGDHVKIRKHEKEIRESTKRLEKLIEILKQESPIGFNCAAIVPEGAMEWLLHEVGHWVAATPSERLLPDYGYGIIKQKDWGATREWQAWGFEEIILAPFGSSRLIAPPEHRGGTVYTTAGPMPAFATTHADIRINELRIGIGKWRSLYAEWLDWSN